MTAKYKYASANAAQLNPGCQLTSHGKRVGSRTF